MYRRLSVLLLASLGCAALAPAHAVQEAARRPMTLEDISRLSSVTGAELSPDGKRLAFTRSVQRRPMADEDGPAWVELFVLDVESGRERPFVTGKVNVSAIEWTQGGAQIAFLAKRGDDKHTALYLIPIDGGEARKAAGAGAAVQSFSLAPDGKRVCLVAAAPEDEGKKKLSDKGFKQEIYEEDQQPSQVWIANLFDSESKPRRLELEGHVWTAHWSPRGDRLLVASAPTPLVDDQYMRQQLSVVDIASGAKLAAFEHAGKLGTMAWSPDAERVAMIGAADIHDPSAGVLMVGQASGGALTPLIPDLPGSVVSIAWQDADTLLAVFHQGVGASLEKLDLDGTRLAARKTLFAGPGPILEGLSLSQDGQAAGLTASSSEHPSEAFFMRHGDAAPRRVTRSNAWLDEVALAPQEIVRFRARDGLELEGLLVRPLRESVGERVPLVLYVHGGPEAHHSNGWLTNYGDPAQVLSARGFAVFHVNYRGSTGRGVAFSKLSQGDPAGKEFEDLVDAVDHLVASGLVDRSKVGVTGGSYGGYATAWLSTRYTERFAAGVMFVGISNKISKVGTTDIADEEYYVHALHRPWEKWQFLLERSPIFHAQASKTPLLILHGKDDPRVNPGQSRELYRHFKLHGQAPVRLVLYPGEGHGNRKAAARLDYSMRLVQWFEHYLQGPGGAMPDCELDYEAAGPSGAIEASAGAGVK
jgi:dipeptidyl aminopeptidase/acylaminoacyl peptidase